MKGYLLFTIPFRYPFSSHVNALYGECSGVLTLIRASASLAKKFSNARSISSSSRKGEVGCSNISVS